LKNDDVINLKKDLIFPIIVNNELIGVIKFSLIEKLKEMSYLEINALKGCVDIIETLYEREKLFNKNREDKIFLDKIVNNVKELIVILDKNLKILFANKSAGESVGRNPVELVGENCFKIWHKRDIPCEICPVQKALLSKNYEEGIVKSPDGRIWHIKAIPILNDKNEVEFVIESTIEITKERELIKKLKENEERFRKILETTNIGISILDKDGNYLYLNKKRAEMLGYSVEEIINKNFKDFVHPEDLNKDKELYEKLVKGEIDNYNIDLKFIKKDGDISFEKVYVSRVDDENGNFLYTVNIVVDITKEVKYEFDLKEKEDILKGIFDQLSVGVNIVDKDKNIILSNKAFQNMIGYSLNELKNMTFIDFTYPDDLEENLKLFDKAKNNEINSFTLEKRFKRKDGSIFWGRVTSNVIKDEKGEIKYLISLIEDIDEKVKYYENLKIEESRLKAIIDIMPDLIFIFDKDGNFLNYYGDFEKLLFKPEDFLGKNILSIFKEDIGLKTVKSIREALYENKISSFVYELPCPKNSKENCFYEARFVKLDEEKVLCLIRDTTNEVRYLNKLKKKEEDLKKYFYQTINLISKIIEMKEPYTAGHQKGTSEIAVLITKELNLDEFKIEAIKIAGLVHDIGKIEIPIEILNKPTKLSLIDWDFIKKHPQIGYEILKEIDFPWNVKEIVLQHHEKYDGSGYPYGLKDDEILLEARIISVADSIEAMSSHRPYRARLSKEKIVEELIKYRGSYYDPQIVDIAIKLIERGDIKI
jgi:PAS domain S-box-containing protein/putative nucleotidyltransferase with HDIG domain